MGNMITNKVEKIKILPSIFATMKKRKDIHLEDAYKYGDELKMKNLQSENLDEKPIGVLLMNVGSPDSPTYFSLWRYLRQFLSDRRVIEVPRIIWNFILYAIILPFRSNASANRYRHIWMVEGSPLVYFSKMQATLIQKHFDELYEIGKINKRVIVSYGMGYGSPSISYSLNFIKLFDVKQLLLFPLFPHSAGATVGSAFDSVAAELKTWRYIPSLRFISGFADNQIYVKSIANLIRKHWREEKEEEFKSASRNIQCINTSSEKFENEIETKGKNRGEKLIISFHGLPLKTVENGDKYAIFCNHTYRLLLKELNLSENECIMAFQSRFGFNEWLRPYLDDKLKELANSGVLRVDVVCPGFVSDCLETLDEIGNEYAELFQLYTNGKGELRTIKCLNDSVEGIEVLTHVIHQNLIGWL